MKTFIIVLVMTCWSSQCFATATYGARDCGQWFDKTPLARMAAEGWLMGYLSGLNMMWASKRLQPSDPLDQLSSAKQAYLWMDNYCKAKPLNNLSDGGLELFYELVEKARK